MELDPAVRVFIDAPCFAVLGTVNADGSPQLSAIWYVRREDEVIVNTTAPRRKARNMDRDPRVSLLISASGRYIRLEGEARVIATGADAVRDIHDLGVRYNGAQSAERQTREVWSKEPRVTYAITVRRVYRYGFE